MAKFAISFVPANIIPFAFIIYNFIMNEIGILLNIFYLVGTKIYNIFIKSGVQWPIFLHFQFVCVVCVCQWRGKPALCPRTAKPQMRVQQGKYHSRGTNWLTNRPIIKLAKWKITKGIANTRRHEEHRQASKRHEKKNRKSMELCNQNK